MELNIHSSIPERKDWRIGCIGSGFIMSDCHLVAYGKAGFNPVAIASRTKANATKCAEQHKIGSVYDSIDQLLDDESIEVLDIAVPPDNQLDVIKAACERGTAKGILAQKPLGGNYAEAVEAVEVCEKAGIVLAVNQNMRYDQSVRAAKTLLDNGTIGEPVLATIIMRGIPHWMPWQERQGWVTLRIMSIHHMDTFRYWFGDPERIYCTVRTDPRTQFPHSDGIASYILEYAGGLRAIAIDDTWTGPGREGAPADIGIEWRIEGLDGLAKGNIGWCQDPYTPRRRSPMQPRATLVSTHRLGTRAGSRTPSSAPWPSSSSHSRPAENRPSVGATISRPWPWSRPPTGAPGNIAPSSRVRSTKFSKVTAEKSFSPLQPPRKEKS